MSGAVLCMVFPSVLDSQNKLQRWCRGGMSRATTQEPIKTMTKRRVKRAGVASAVLSWLPGWLPLCPVVCLCFWFLVLCLFAPVFLVLAPGLAFMRKGDVPRTDPFVSLPVGGFFRFSLVCWRYREVLQRFVPPPISFVSMCLLALSTRLHV